MPSNRRGKVYRVYRDIVSAWSTTAVRLHDRRARLPRAGTKRYLVRLWGRGKVKHGRESGSRVAA